MTEKQQLRIIAKIKKLKAELAADKKRWGGYYDDSRGLRYVPPHLYIQLADYSGGMRYMNWFAKNFSDDMGFPEFLFEWTIILFKNGKMKQAEKKAFETFCRNIYVFDKFFGKELIPIDLPERSNIESIDYINSSFEYDHRQAGMTEFAAWLNSFLQTQKFRRCSSQLLEARIQLKNEHDKDKRWALIRMAGQLAQEFD